MKVSALYHPMTVICNDRESLADVASRMRFNDVGSAAVLRDGRVAGIITERDLARAIADGIDARRTVVGDYMTSEPVVVGPDTEAKRAALIMLDAGIRHLPVVDDDRHLLGLVSVRDVLLELVSAPQA
ncbi:MAG: CBS domain-containing protein [Actinomycetota bacterium]